MKTFLLPRGAAALMGLALASVMTVSPTHAALFGDDEARRAILELRGRVDANRQAAEEAQKQLGQEVKESGEVTRRALIDLSNQIDGLRRELAEMRGQNEKLARDLAELQRQQRDVLSHVDERLRPLEPVKVSLDGVEFTAQPEEKAAFEAAMATVRASDFVQAARQFADFMLRYPQSGYTPAAPYWQGNALYAARSYKPAIESYQKLVARAPKHPKAPEAMLAIASCHVELKDTKAARAAWQDLVKTYPDSEAAAAAKERLARSR